MSTPKPNLRIAALRRFALSITLFNILGHTVFGFEQAWFYPPAALALSYSLELLLEWLVSRSQNYAPRYRGRGFIGLVDFLLPAHISALAIAMLLYPGERVGPILFAVAVCIGSKVLFRVRNSRGSQHFLNPSNFGIALTLILFPWVGISPPYHFTENISGALDWVVPAVIVLSGSLLNTQLTRKHPLILGWLGGFVLQAVGRRLLFGTPLAAALLPMTGVAFLLFTFYMITDPGTTPFEPRAQVRFGLATALVYGLLVSVHVVFGLFFALVLVCAGRGIGLALQQTLAPSRHPKPEFKPAPAAAAQPSSQAS